ncbi:MAG: hypothetical protein ACO4AI_16410, partial [Prochlorothrix sp.]
MSNSSADSATCVVTNQLCSRATLALCRNSAALVEYGACGDKPAQHRPTGKPFAHATASATIDSGSL